MILVIMRILRVVLLAAFVGLPMWSVAQVNGMITPNAPVNMQSPKYPLRVRILQEHWRQTHWTLRGFGRGNLMGSPLQGFDFTYECSPPFMATPAGETYPARWKRKNTEIEILTGRIGHPNRFNKCTLLVSMHLFAYRHRRRR